MSARPPDAPAAGSHDRSVPTGTLEVSAATLFDAMLAARDADPDGNPGPLREFYRTLMASTLLLPVPPGTDEEAKRALAQAVTDQEEVEIAVMMARDGEGQPVNVLFASPGALAAWAPVGTTSLPLPARIVFANLASSGLPAVLDPAGPIPYRFETDEVAALAGGRLPSTDEPLFMPTAGASIRVRLPGTDARALEAGLREALRATDVDAAYLVEVERDGRWRLLLGLTGRQGATATVDVPDGTEVEWLDGSLLRAVEAVAGPFYRRR